MAQNPKLEALATAVDNVERARATHVLIEDMIQTESRALKAEMTENRLATEQRIERIELKLETLSELVKAGNGQLGRVEDRLERTVERLERVEDRTSVLSGKIDGLSADLAETFAKLEVQIAQGLADCKVTNYRSMNRLFVFIVGLLATLALIGPTLNQLLLTALK